MLWEDELSSKDKKVFQFVKEHPGSSQEGVVKEMRSDISRLTVIKILEKLEDYDMILFKKEKPNSQIYKIYVNNDNLLVAVEQTLSEFQRSFFVLLDRLRGKIEETCLKRTGQAKRRDIDAILSQLFNTHQIVIHGQVLWKLRHEWIRQVQDKESLHRLYYLVFSTMMEIEYKFSNFFYDLDEQNIDYDVNLGMDKGFLPGVRPPRFPSGVLTNFVPISKFRWEVFQDWDLVKEAKDLSQCIIKFIEMK
jgi:hypothetical protein